MNPIDISSIVLISINLFAALVTGALIVRPFADGVMISAFGVDGYLLCHFFAQHRTIKIRPENPEITPTGIPSVQGVSR